MSDPMQNIVMRELIPLEEPRVATIDEISSGCGMFYGYKCRAAQNDAEGICHTFGCPIAEPMDDEDEQWKPYMEGYHYMLQHSRFAGWQSMRTCPINTKVFLWNEANEEVSIGYKPSDGPEDEDVIIFGTAAHADYWYPMLKRPGNQNV